MKSRLTSLLTLAGLLSPLLLVSGATSGGVGPTSAPDGCEAEAEVALEQHLTPFDGGTLLPAVDVEVCGHILPIAEVADLKVIASDEGVSLAEALSTYGWQGDFVDATTLIEQTFPNLYAGAEFRAEGGSWVAFRDTAPVAALEMINNLPIQVIESRGFSEAELNDILVEEYLRIYNRDDVADVAGGYDQVTGVITIDVLPDGALSEAQREQLLDELQPPAPANSAITIEIGFLKGPSGGFDGTLRGGGYIGGCTSGFGVKSTDGTRTGVTTADHGTCGGSSSHCYKHHGSSTCYTVSRRGRTGGGEYGDVAWFGSNSHTGREYFYYNWNQFRTATTYKATRTGVTYCRFGIKTALRA
jgi:hypothetical protein